MYKQFKFFLWKKKIQRATKEEQNKKKKEIVSELKHKFNISFLICGCLAERKTENEKQVSSFIGHHFCSFNLGNSVECRGSKWKKPSEKIWWSIEKTTRNENFIFSYWAIWFLLHW